MTNLSKCDTFETSERTRFVTQAGESLLHDPVASHRTQLPSALRHVFLRHRQILKVVQQHLLSRIKCLKNPDTNSVGTQKSRHLETNNESRPI